MKLGIESGRKPVSGSRLFAWALSISLLTTVAPVPVLAQSASVEEVVVSARRRDETVQDVPLAISVVSGDDLARIGAADIIAIGQSTPNVTLEVSRGTNTTLTAFIRGVGQQDPVAGFESGVGLYVDDVYFNRAQAAVLDLYEVERIEVLRGPQGTLYGRNTIGGAIKYVTRDLSAEPTGKVRFSAGNFGQIDALLSGSLPLADNLRIGGAVARFTRDGFGDNLNLPGVENYNKDILGARLTVEWDALENLSFRLTGDYTDDSSDPRAGHRLTVGAVSGAPILDNVFDTRAGLMVPEQDVEAIGGALTAQWDITDTITLKNIVAYRDDRTTSPIDFDSLPADDLDVPVLYDNHQFSEELQLLYSSERLNGILGYYYLSANAFNDFDVVLGQLGPLIGVPGLNANTLGDVNTETWSLFADFTYDLNDQVSVSVGGRYTSDERNSLVLRRTFAGGISPTFGGTAVVAAVTSNFNGTAEDTDFSPRVSVAWQPNDAHNLYLSYSEGFKGGSFDPRAQSTAAPDLNNDGTVSDDEIFRFMRFEPETVKSWEFGVKSVLLDNRLTTNVAVFFADYQNVQIPGSIGIDTDNDGVNDTFTGVTTNAASADLPGFEFEGIFQLDDNWAFTWALGYLNAEYNEFIDASGTDVSDEAVFQNTPEWTAHLSANYEREVDWFGLAGSVAMIASVSHRDDASQFEFRNELLDQEAFQLWDLSLVWEDSAGLWRAGLHGKNLTDEEYKVSGYNFPALGLEGNVTAFFGNPRTWTATIERRF